MENATPREAHMTFPTLVNAMRFIKEINPKLLMVSGGEPTDHPQFHDFMGYIRTYHHGVIIIASNGLFMNDGKEAIDGFMSKYANDSLIKWQITNDKRYYPKPLNPEMVAYATQKYGDQAMFLDQIGGEIYPQGRAVSSLKITAEDAKGTSSRCFNIRSALHANESLSSAVKMLESRMRFCTPNIAQDGNIGLGESSTCPPVANVNTYKMATLEEAIRNSQCNECGMNSKLSLLHRVAIKFYG